MKKLWITVIAIVTLIVLIGVGLFILSKEPITIDPVEAFLPELCSNNPYIVSRVIDGDTFELCSGDTIRLLCVDTPEKGEQGYEEAQAFLEDLLLYNEVELKESNYDGPNTDKYNRLLRWVYISNSTTGEQILVNKYLLEEGYGDILIIPPETCNEVAD